MSWLRELQPQEEDVSIGQPPAQGPADPERVNSDDIPLFDETGGVAPPPPKQHDDWPPIWK